MNKLLHFEQVGVDESVTVKRLILKLIVVNRELLCLSSLHQQCKANTCFD